MNWNKVEDSLPEITKSNLSEVCHVWFITDDGRHVYCNGLMYGGEFWTSKAKVTHWMYEDDFEAEIFPDDLEWK